ncbi:MAG: tRNA preQ1(34) S-adenosylmethionine ribosyltransferase-isomerase QueA [Chloroflexota bacterium]
MKTSDFDYYLPSELIAQMPIEPRDHSRLLVLDRQSGLIEHRLFSELPDYLKSGDVLVFNDSRVIPARLNGRKTGSGGKAEVLLLRRLSEGEWEALVKPGRRLRPGTTVEIADGSDGGDCRLTIDIKDVKDNGVRLVNLSDETLLPALGKIPLPPYIHTPLSRPERYQTVYARSSGSVAAPTAGLHLTPELLDSIKQKGAECLFVTLHIGLDTFRPVAEEDPQEHQIHSEYGIISEEVATRLSRAKRERRRVICVGTTAVRLVEQASQLSKKAPVEPFSGWVNLFILPSYKFRVMDALVTNFHLPRSTLLMLVSAFANRELILKAYAEAIREKYRFYSFGDAMLVV